MKSFLFIIAILSLFNELNAEIIYLDPVQNAKYVSIDNGIIIGFDNEIEIKNNSDINSLFRIKGSLSGIHTGNVILISDQKKILFKPYTPFYFNETVEVIFDQDRSLLNNKKSLTYNFRTQSGRPEWDYNKSIQREFERSGDNLASDNSNLLDPPVMTLITSNNPSPGDLYMSNFPFQPIPNTPYLLIARNTGVYSYQRELSDRTLDFKKQPNGLITYFTNGKFYAEDYQHNLIDSFVCGNGYVTDGHELKILNNGHLLLMSYDPQTVDMSQIVPGGNPNATVIGLIIQELDQNKNVVFQWRSWDNFDITDAVHEDLTAATVDYAHGNAIEPDSDGNLLISVRHFSEITKISRTTGEIIWRLGGENNQFTFTNDVRKFSYQHDIRRIANGNITLFDNGNYHKPQYSRAVEYHLDEQKKTATLVWQYVKIPYVLAFAMGSVQRLQNGNTLIGWGSSIPSITEVTPAGSIALEMSMPNLIFSYRVFRDEVNITVNLKLAIEAIFDNTSDKLNLSDTVRAFLRSNNSPYNIIDSSKAVIDSVSFTGNCRYYNAASGTYYISVRHRNGIETWSKTGGESYISGRVYQYDFTNSISKSYGNNMILKGSKYCIYSGDVNQDGTVDLADVSQIDNDALFFAAGYIPSDINGDWFVDVEDAVFADNNGFNFVSKVSP